MACCARDVISSSDAVHYIQHQLARGQSCHKAADGLMNLALKRYTEDNVAAVVVDLVGSKRRRRRTSAAKAARRAAGGWGFRF